MRILVILLALFCACSPASAQRFIFALTGQSNMSGSEVQPTTWPTYANAARIYTFGYFGRTNYDTWTAASEPLGDPAAGVSPAMAFASKLIDLLDANPVAGWTSGTGTIGLVLRAYGGSDTRQWMPTLLEIDIGNYYYGGTIKSLLLASTSGPIKGWIDYQGESDAQGIMYPSASSAVNIFLPRKRDMWTAGRNDLGIAGLPFILTKIGPDPTTYGPTTQFPYWSAIQACAANIDTIKPYRIKVVSASDLTGNWAGVGAHLTPTSLVTLGERYAVTMYGMLQ